MASFVPDRFLREGRHLPADLEETRGRIEQLARGQGLDFFDTVFEMCTYEEINMIAAYGGFPTRYPHWRWGMEFLEMQRSYEYGLSKIYELVINNDPSYAYLMDCNLPVDQKLVIAHVYGHVDFFKNNLWFAPTNRKMLDGMANHATLIRRIQERHGETEVERFIDLALSLDNLVDPFAPHIVRTHGPLPEEEIEAQSLDRRVGRLKAGPAYMEPFVNPPTFLAEQAKKRDAEIRRLSSFPEEPTRDVLGFLVENAPLARWQRTILQIIRDEAMYFAPQGQTKIMNEGWASYWHTWLMTRFVLDDSEIVDFADHNAGTMAMQPGRLNPYKLGVELWRHVERRWNKGQFGKEWLECADPQERERWDTGAGLGREKIFQVRRTHNDVTFVDEFLTPEFCEDQGFFTTKLDKKTGRWVVDSQEFAAVKKQLLDMIATRGTPRVLLVDANAHNRQEMRLRHEHEGMDLQLEWAGSVLGNLAALWGRAVHLDTVVENKPVTLTHDGAALRQSKRSEGG